MKEFMHEFIDKLWYYVPSDLERAVGLWPARGGYSIGKLGYKVGPVVPSLYSLHFVVSGQILVTLGENGQHLVVPENGLFVKTPGYLVTYQNHPPASPLRLHWLTMDGPQVAALLERAGITPGHPVLPNIVTQEIVLLLQQFYTIIHEQYACREYTLLSLLYQLFGRIQQQKSHDQASSWLHRCKQHIEMHYSQGITIHEVARLVGVHRSTLSKKFTEKYSMTPQRYLQQLKMDRSAQLLKENSLTISEIADAVGYPDLFSFTRAFHNYFGLPPSVYRKQ